MQASPTHGFWNLPTNAALHGHALDAHLLLNLWIALALLVLAHLILLIGLAARRRSQPTHLWRIEYLPLIALALLFAGSLACSTREYVVGSDPPSDLDAAEADGAELDTYRPFTPLDDVGPPADAPYDAGPLGATPLCSLGGGQCVANAPSACPLPSTIQGYSCGDAGGLVCCVP